MRRIALFIYMKKISLIVLSIAAGCMLWSCEDLPGTDIPKGDEITFAANIGAFQVKSTDTGFEDGDAIGLYALEPVNAVNVKLTVRDGVLTPESPVYWGEGQTAATAFYAYYPYSASFVPTGETLFSLPTNQSTKATYCSCDIMGANTAAAPDGGAVRLNFMHLLSKVEITLTGSLAASVSKVEIKDIPVKANIKVSDREVTASTENGTVTACPVELAGGAKAWWAIVIPGTNLSPTVVVTTSDGQVFEYVTPTVQNFDIGYKYPTELAVEPSAQPTPVEFNFSVTDWNNDGPINFILKEDDVPPTPPVTDGYLIHDGETMLAMTPADDGTWVYTYPYSSLKDTLKIGVVVKDDICYSPAAVVLEDWLPCTPGMNEPFKVISLAPLKVIFDPAKCQLMLTEFGESQTGSMVEDIMSLSYGTPRIEYPVEIARRLDGANVFKIFDPFAKHPNLETIKKYNGTFDPNWTEYLIIDATNPEEVYLKHNYLSIIEGSTGDRVQVGSLVFQNRFNMGEYGYMDGADIVFPVGSIGINYGEGWKRSGKNIPTVITLPGNKRHTVLLSTLESVAYYGTGMRADGTHYASFVYSLEVDNTCLRYCVEPFDGSMTQAKLDAATTELKNGGGTSFANLTPGSYLLALDLETMGRYVAYFYTEGSDGTWWYAWRSFYYLPYGEEAPANDAQIATVTADEAKPDEICNIKLIGSDIMKIYVTAVPVNDLGAVVPDESDYAAYAVGKGGLYEYAGKTGEFFVSCSGLDAATRYRIIIYVVNGYGVGSVLTADYTTGGALQWESIGTGKFYDYSQFVKFDDYCTDGYVTDVTVEKVVGQNHYRILNPYASFWRNATASALALKSTDEYISDNIEFYLKPFNGTNFVVFYDFHSGVKDKNFVDPEIPDHATLSYIHGAPNAADPANNVYSVNNVQIADGVFQLAPYVIIGGTQYAYPYNQNTDAFIIALPGYSYTPPVGEEAAPSSAAPKRAIGAPAVTYRVPKTFSPASRYVKAPYTIMSAGRLDSEKVFE